ncbi:hypothetical protein GV790_30270, partial [Nocardia cyriacigeorgica]|nr:hypothetical protein [Nocardia cyriacigeorgica]
DYDESDYDEPDHDEPGGIGARPAARAEADDDLSGDAAIPSERDPAGRTGDAPADPPPARRPSLAVVPDVRPAAREDRWSGADRPESADRTS